MSFNLTIISQDKVVKDTEVDEVLVPTAMGQIGVLSHHMDMVSLLQTGEIVVTSHGKTEHFAVFGGVAQINGKEVKILADRAEPVSDINLAQAEEAHRRAEAMVKEAKDDVEMAYAQGLLERNLNRIRLVKNRRHHGSHQHTPESIQ